MIILIKMHKIINKKDVRIRVILQKAAHRLGIIAKINNRYPVVIICKKRDKAVGIGILEDDKLTSFG